MPIEGKPSVSSVGAILVSLFIMGTFGFVMTSVFLWGAPTGDNSIIIGLVELLKTLAILVAGYWVGSSAGSKRSADAIRAIAQKSTGTEPPDGPPVT